MPLAGSLAKFYLTSIAQVTQLNKSGYGGVKQLHYILYMETSHHFVLNKPWTLGTSIETINI